MLNCNDIHRLSILKFSAESLCPATQLKGSRFIGANLERTDFKDATIEDTNFQGANLKGAPLG
jgi:uncharacterized protein YjbI with pentapeptide repeats